MPSVDHQPTGTGQVLGVAQEQSAAGGQGSSLEPQPIVESHYLACERRPGTRSDGKFINKQWKEGSATGGVIPDIPVPVHRIHAGNHHRAQCFDRNAESTCWQVGPHRGRRRLCRVLHQGGHGSAKGLAPSREVGG